MVTDVAEILFTSLSSGFFIASLLLVPLVQAEPRTLIRLGHTSEEVTLNNLMSKLPKGATVTDTSCIRIGTGRGYRYRCQITFE